MGPIRALSSFTIPYEAQSNLPGAENGELNPRGHKARLLQTAKMTLLRFQAFAQRLSLFLIAGAFNKSPTQKVPV